MQSPQPQEDPATSSTRDFGQNNPPCSEQAAGSHETIFDHTISLDPSADQSLFSRQPLELPTNSEDTVDAQLEYRRRAADSKAEQIIEDGLKAHREVSDLFGIGLQDRIELEWQDGELTTKSAIPNDEFPFDLKDLRWMVLSIPNSNSQDKGNQTSLYGHIQEQSALADAITQSISSKDLKLHTWSKFNVRVFATQAQNILVFPASQELIDLIFDELGIAR